MYPSRPQSIISAVFDAGVRAGAIVVVALSAAGCASNKAPSYVAGPPMSQAAKRVAVATPADVEDDGRPAQVVPGARHPRVPDDPTQPWSPNYGGPASPKVQPTPTQIQRPQQPTRRPKTQDTAGPAPMPVPLPAPPRTAMMQPRHVPVSAVAVDDVVVRAIAAHEMRNR